MTPETNTPPSAPEQPSWWRRLFGWFSAPVRPVELQPPQLPAARPADPAPVSLPAVSSVAAGGQAPPASNEHPGSNVHPGPNDALQTTPPLAGDGGGTSRAARDVGPGSSVVSGIVASSAATGAAVTGPLGEGGPGSTSPAGAQGGAAASTPGEPLLLQTEPLRRLAERLALEEIDAGIARSLMAEILRELPRERWDQEVEVYSVAAWVLMRWAQITGPIKVKRGAMTVVAVVGPTGVGKSTTLAKLASIAALKDKNAVGLISTDTYRIAAAEQIRIFAKLLSLPLAVVRTREEMQAALNEYAQRDVVFIDTAGQSPNDIERLRELEELLGPDSTVRRHLVLSATTKHSDVQDILERFEPVGYDGLIITKLDESRSHGVLLNAPHWSGRPLTYLGVGQGIPRDIEVATRERVVDLMLNLSGRFHKKG